MPYTVIERSGAVRSGRNGLDMDMQKGTVPRVLTRPEELSLIFVSYFAAASYFFSTAGQLTTFQNAAM